MTGQRVFVPGCGRGYDVVAFAQAGAAAAVGLELAPTAAQCASEYVAAELEGQEAAARAAVYCGDFFKWWVNGFRGTQGAALQCDDRSRAPCAAEATVAAGAAAPADPP